MKVLKNFGCNGVKKKVGQSLSKEEVSQIGSFLESLLKNDFLQKSAEPKQEVKEEKKEEKKKEKKSKK